jgi:hypothetical protein
MVMQGESYDEDLAYNPFYKLLQSKHKRLMQRAEATRCLVCVPRAGSCQLSSLSRDDIEAHVLLPSDNSAIYSSANEKTVHIQNNQITTQVGFKEPRIVRILFEEAFYNASDESYRVLCLSSPLSGSKITEGTLAPLASVGECSVFLSSDSSVNRKLLSRVVDSIEIFNRSSSLPEKGGWRLILDGVGAIYTKAVQSFIKESSYKKIVKSNPQILNRIKGAIESYVMDGVYDVVMTMLSTTFASRVCCCDVPLTFSISVSQHNFQVLPPGSMFCSQPEFPARRRPC